jgi:hypothetical protein
MKTAAASGAESEDTVRILKDIRDEIRHVRNELRDEIRGVRTERVDRPDRGRKLRAALIALGFGVVALAVALIPWRGGGQAGAPRGGSGIAALGTPVSTQGPPIPASPQPAIAAPMPISAAPAPVAARAPVARPLTAVAAAKRAPARHRARPPTEAELEEPAKL